MTKTVSLSLVFTAAGLLATTANVSPALAASTVVNFDTATSTNPFTGIYSQDGYNVSYASGTLDIYAGGGVSNSIRTNDIAFANGSTGTFNLTRADGGIFSLQSLNGFSTYSTNGNDLEMLTYVLTGFLSGATTYAQTFTTAGNSGTPAALFSVTSAANTFDRLQFSITQTKTSAYVDNITVTSLAGAVPEPATWAMMLFGFGATGFAMRRRQTITTRASYAG